MYRVFARLLVLSLFIAPAFAQTGGTNVVAYPTGVPIVAGTPGEAVPMACDKYGTCNTSIASVVVSATGLGKAEDSVAASGDTGVFSLNVANNNETSLAANGDYVGHSVTTAGVGINALVYSADIGTVRQPTKLEDTASATGDSLMSMGGIRNGTLNTFTTTEGHYTNMAVTGQGQPIAIAMFSSTIAVADQLGKREDTVAANADVGVPAMGIQRSTDSNGAGDGDYQALSLDMRGAALTSMASAGATWQSCSASNTGTSDTAIKASVASNRIYVTSISCFNTATVASSIIFKDGATQIYVGGISNSTLQGVAYYETTLPVPLRLTSATAFNFAMGTTATATTCCAAGYTSAS